MTEQVELVVKGGLMIAGLMMLKSILSVSKRCLLVP